MGKSGGERDPGERLPRRIPAQVASASGEVVEKARWSLVCRVLRHLCRLRGHGRPRLPQPPRPCSVQGHEQPGGEEEDLGLLPLGQGQLSEDECFARYSCLEGKETCFWRILRMSIVHRHLLSPSCNENGTIFGRVFQPNRNMNVFMRQSK